MDIIRKFGTIVTVVGFTIASLQAQQGSEVYDYPIKPGTLEWKALTSHDEMQKVCQIPDAILRNMSTEKLIETCLNYPLYGDMFAFDEFQKGFESVTSGFNGLQELLKREDAGIKLIQKYQQMNPDAFDEKWSLVKKGEYAARFYTIEILLAQEQILYNLRKDQIRTLVRESIKKIQAKRKYPEVYGIISFGNLALLLGRAMVKENFIPFNQKVLSDEKIRIFLQTAFLPTGKLVDEILNYAIRYDNEN